MPPKDANPGKKEAAALRRDKAIAMRVGGAVYRDIATALGVGVRQAYDDVQRVLKDDKALHQGEIEQERAVQLRRLEGMWLRAWTRYTSGEFSAWQACLRIMERQARLLGLDAPTKIAPTDAEGRTLEFTLRLGEVDAVIRRPAAEGL